MSGPATTPDTPGAGAPDPLSSPLDGAQVLTARGWVVFPCDHPDAGLHCTGSARRCRERRCGADDDPSKRGKHPRLGRWGGLGVAGSAQLAAWFGPDAVPANVAIACGPSGLMVVDEDRDDALRAYAASIGTTVPHTFRVRSARGWHWYFTVPVDPATGERYLIGNSPGALAGWGCDVRGGASETGEHGGYAITAGSLHVTGITYTAPEPYAPCAVAPEWLIAAVQAPYAGVGPYLGKAGPAGQGPSADAPEGSGTDPRTGPGVGSASATVAGGPGGAQRAPGGTTGGAAGGTSGGARWDTDVRYGTAAALRAQFARHCAEVTLPGDAFRLTLMPAARDGWRMVALGLIAEDEMLREIEACVWRVWQAPPDERDKVIVFEEALTGPNGAINSPWELEPGERIERAAERLITSGEPVQITTDRFMRPTEAAAAGLAARLTRQDTESGSTTDGNRTVPGDRDTAQDEDRGEVETPAELAARRSAEADEIEYTEVLRRERFRRRARADLDAEDLPPLVMLSVDEWDETPDLDYLVPRLFYRNTLASVFGAPGVAKSYFLLDIALSLATGRTWRGHRLTGRDGGPGVVHYVMAEGLDVNKSRRNAWLRYHGLSIKDLRGRFIVTDGEGLLLTMAGISQYRKYVQRDCPDLILLDTKNALFTGEESSGRDHGEMIRALNTLRKDAGGATVVLIGHSGLGDLTRSRGSNAEEAGVNTATRVTRDEQTGLFTAFEKRDKSAGAVPAEWHWRLETVPGVSVGAHMDLPAVCIPVDPDEMRAPVHIEGSWYTDDTPVPDEVGALRGHGRKYALLVFRVLRWVDRRDGLAASDLASALGKVLGDEYDRSQLNRALGVLEKEGIIEHPLGASAPLTGRWALTDRFAGPALGAEVGS